MATDAWGIDDGYEDAGGEWQDVSEETISAIRAAMGSEAQPPTVRREVRVVREHQSMALPPGKLTLEDGGSIDLPGGELPPDLPTGYHDFIPARRTATARAADCHAGPLPVAARGALGWALNFMPLARKQAGGLAIWPICGAWPSGRKARAPAWC